jgi:RNA polymerase sigma-70 factor (ECF subfamily)
VQTPSPAAHPPAPEVEWARRLLAGDASAFTPFVESFQHRIFQYTWLMCGQREDAEEVAQDTLLKIFESFDQLQDPERVKAWVFRIAKNYCLMKRRKSVFAPEREYSLDELIPAVGDVPRAFLVPDSGELPEDRVLRSELGSKLEEALRQLPEIYRSVVLLRDVEGLSTAEAAEVLDLSEDVVKQRLHRGRLALRKALASYVAASDAEAQK